MTDRRALFLSLAERVEKLGGRPCGQLDWEIALAYGIVTYRENDAGDFRWFYVRDESLGGGAAETCPVNKPFWGLTHRDHRFTASYDAIASLPGPEVITVSRTPTGWIVETGNGAIGEAPTRLLAELAARLRGMAEMKEE